MAAEPIAFRRGAAGQGQAGSAGALNEALAAVHAAMARLNEVVRVACPESGAPIDREQQSQWHEALGTLDRTMSVMEVVRASVLGVVRRSARWDGPHGGRGFVDWRGRASRQGRGAAIAEQNLTQVLTELPQVREAVEAGEVTVGHARAVGDALAGAGERAREVLTKELDDVLRMSRVEPVPVVKRRIKAAIAAAEADAADRSFDATYARRYLRLTSRAGGVGIEGFLDPIAGEKARIALEALTPVPAVDDERSSDQRRADAFASLADRVMTIGDDRAGAQIRPHVSVLVREDTWLLLQHRRRLSCPSRDGDVGEGDVAEGGVAEGGVADDEPRPGQGINHRARVAAGLATEPPLAELMDGTLVPFGQLDVLSCDAVFRRLVLDPVGKPLDVGRAERTYEKALRQAVIVRDRHCQWPGCTMRARWCEVHHIWRWRDGGPTNEENGITLCVHHHHVVHRENVHVLPVPGGFRFTSHDGHRIGESSRLHDELLVPRRPPPGDRGGGGDPGGGGGRDPGVGGGRDPAVGGGPDPGPPPSTPGARSREGRLGREAVRASSLEPFEFPAGCPASDW